MINKLSVVIPFHNEESNLPLLMKELVDFLPSLRMDWEIVLVNDFSNDGSLTLVEILPSEKVKIISLLKRSGQASALQAGFEAADGDWLLTMDADLESDIKELPKLLVGVDEADFISGARMKRQSSLLKKLSSRLFRIFCRCFLKADFKDVNSPFRLFKRNVLSSIRLSSGLHRYLAVMANRLGFKTLEVEIVHRPRFGGQSKYPPFSRLVQTVKDFIFVLRHYPEK
jgi:dolichol-phosphate mannosyltransferase